MAQLRQQHPRFLERSTAVIVVGPESRQAFIDYWRKNDLPFVGLPDPQHRVLDLYGQQFKLLRLGRMPAQVIIDMNGVIRWAHHGDSMSDIPPGDEILGLLDALDDREA